MTNEATTMAGPGAAALRRELGQNQDLVELVDEVWMELLRLDDEVGELPSPRKRLEELEDVLEGREQWLAKAAGLRERVVHAALGLGVCSPLLDRVTALLPHSRAREVVIRGQGGA